MTKTLPEGAIAPWKPWWLSHFDTPEGHFEIVSHDWVTAEGEDLGETYSVHKEQGVADNPRLTEYKKVSDYFETYEEAAAYVAKAYGCTPTENK